jgi:hypothetical protein
MGAAGIIGDQRTAFFTRIVFLHEGPRISGILLILYSIKKRLANGKLLKLHGITEKIRSPEKTLAFSFGWAII